VDNGPFFGFHFPEHTDASHTILRMNRAPNYILGLQYGQEANVQILHHGISGRELMSIQDYSVNLQAVEAAREYWKLYVLEEMKAQAR
jgi:hypothetical protein